MRRVLFLCGGNSCRSQMAEGWARHLLKGEFHSAGLRADGLNPMAVRAMGEAGVDITGQTSKTMDLLEGDFHVVVTVCDPVRETCPYLPALELSIHRSFPDPPALAQALPEDRRMEPYRDVCTGIMNFVDTELRRILEQP